jgi:hypothetical protein
MNYELDRSLTVRADGNAIAFRHACLSGRDALGLYPMPFMLRLWNLSESDYHLLRASRQISVLHGDSVLASGSISDVYLHTVPEGTLTEIVFAAGLELWEAPVSLSVEAGVTVSETVRRILSASGAGIPLLSFPSEDFVSSRPQSFYGRAAECVTTALSAASARAVLSPSGLMVIRPGGLPVSMVLTEKDLTDAPSFAGGAIHGVPPVMILSVSAAGWRPGETVRVEYKDIAAAGIITDRGVDTDTAGVWKSGMVIEII